MYIHYFELLRPYIAHKIYSVPSITIHLPQMYFTIILPLIIIIIISLLLLLLLFWGIKIVHLTSAVKVTFNELAVSFLFPSN